MNNGPKALVLLGLCCVAVSVETARADRLIMGVDFSVDAKAVASAAHADGAIELGARRGTLVEAGPRFGAYALTRWPGSRNVRLGGWIGYGTMTTAGVDDSAARKWSRFDGRGRIELATDRWRGVSSHVFAEAGALLLVRNARHDIELGETVERGTSSFGVSGTVGVGTSYPVRQGVRARIDLTVEVARLALGDGAPMMEALSPLPKATSHVDLRVWLALRVEW